MHIKDSKKDQATIVMIEGRLDSSNSGTLEKKITALLEAGESNFLFDFTAMDYISSAGLRTFLSTAKKMKARDGNLCMARLRDNVKDVFTISGFIALIPAFDTLGAAQDSIR